MSKVKLTTPMILGVISLADIFHGDAAWLLLWIGYGVYKFLAD